MSWGFGNSAGLYQIHSFAEIKKKYDETRPIRGRTTDDRPLGRNRARSDFLVKKHWEVVEDGYLGRYVEAYSANVWRNDVIKWYSDGKVAVRPFGYSSPTINATINYSLSSGYGELQSCNGKPYFRTKDGKSYRITRAGLLFEPTGEEVSSYGGVIAKVMRPLNPIQEYKYRANRKEMNKIRKHYKKFLDYGIAMFSIDDKITDADKRRENGWYYYNFTYSKWNNEQMVLNRGRVFKMIDEFIDTDNLETAYQAANELGHGFGWNGRCSAKQFADGLTEILKYRFKDSVFHKEAIEIGTAFYDRNYKYFM